jgi:hypothetical protein
MSPERLEQELAAMRLRQFGISCPDGKCQSCLKCRKRQQRKESVARIRQAERMFDSAVADATAGLRPRAIPPLAPYGFTGTSRYGGHHAYLWQMPLPDDVIVIRNSERAA